MSSKLETRVIQVTNVAPTTTKDQLKTLFQFIGRIREIKVFPPEGSDQQVAAKVCYIEFDDSTSAGVSLHLTNTVFIDRALIVVPVMDGKIPDEKVAMQLTPQTVARMTPGQPAWPANVVSQYPPLPANLDAAKVEEIRRTVYIANLDPKTTPEQLISFFSQAGEVKYVRMAGDESLGTRGAYLEMTDQRSVATCLGYNGVEFNGRIITVSHAKTCISKPLTKSQEASRREIEEAMKKVKEAQSLISAAAGERSRSRSRSRRRSRSRGFSRSRSRSRRRSRSRSRGRRRRSRSRSRGRRSRSPRRRRSRTRSPRRRRSRSRSGIVVIPARERRRSRSRSRRRSRTRSPKRRSRTPPRAYSSRRSRSRSRKKSPGGRRRSSRSHSRGKGKDRKSKEREKKKEKKKSGSRTPSPPKLEREGSGDEGSPVKRTSSEIVSAPAGKSTSEATADKKTAVKRERSKSPVVRRRKSVSRSPVKTGRKRSASRSPVRSSRRRSPSPRKRRSKSRSPRRSRSPVKKKKARSPRRSRSGSRHRSKKDKKKERSRSRDRKDKEKKKKSSKEKREDKDKGTTGKVVRDYDEEEKGYNSGSDHEMRSQPGDREEDDARSSGGDQQLVDMDTSD